MSEWIAHVKQFQAQNGCSYKDALKHASASYRAMKGSGNMRDLNTALTSRKARKASQKYGPDMSYNPEVDYGYAGLGVGRRNKYNKWTDALGARQVIDAGMSKAASTISGSGVGRRNKYNKWTDALGARQVIDAGMSKAASTISGSGMTKKQAISALQMANAMYGDQAMSQLKTHRRKLSGMALYPAGTM